MSDKRAPFPYMGGKARYADWIVSYLPTSPCYVEPFGGAGAVLFTKPKVPNEVYNDANGDLVQFFVTLRDHPDELAEWVRHTPYSRELYHEFADPYFADEREDDPIERAGRFFYLRYAQWGGKIRGKGGFAVSKTRRGRSQRYKNARAALAEFADRLSDVTVENLDWRECIDRYDGDETVFYLDPPYVGAEKAYPPSFDGSDHAALADTLAKLDAQFVCSYETIPDPLDRPEFHYVRRTTTRDLSGGRNNDEQKEVTETLIMNFEPQQNPNQATLGEVA